MATNPSDTYLNADLPPVEAQLTEEVSLMTEKTELSLDDIRLITEQVFAPLVQVFAGENPLYPYQMEVACGICYALLAAVPYTPTILQARQCFPGGTVVLDTKGNAYRIEESPNSFVTGKNKQLYRVVGFGGYTIDGVTEEHVIFTTRGEVRVADLLPTDRLVVSKEVSIWEDIKTLNKTQIVNPRHKTLADVSVDVSEDLFEILGLLSSDGYTRGISDGSQSVKFTNTNQDLVARYRGLVQSVSGDETKLSSKGSGWDVFTTGSKPVSRFLQILRCIDWDHGFPTSVFRTNRAVASAFIRGVIAGDGCIQPNRNVIEISAGLDKVYADYIKALLHKLGVRSTIKSEVNRKSNTFYRLVISGAQNIITLVEAVGYVEGKQTALEQIKIKNNHNTRNDYGDIWVENGITFETTRLLSVTKTTISELVYDRTEPETGWYLVNGVKVHNSGKSEAVACTVLALGVLMPQLFKLFKAKQIRRFKKGFRVGVYGPIIEKASIIATRIKEKSRSEHAHEIFQDPDLGINPNEIIGLKFPNGFSVQARSAKKGTNVEGPTYDLIICDEAQEIDSYILNKSIRPMKASTNGLIVLIGTPTPVPCAFQQTCYQNEHRDSLENKTEHPYRRHYEFDWTYCASANENYKEHVKQEMLEIGRHSDEFKLAYDLEWLDTKGRFFTRGDLQANAIQEPTEFEDYQERTKVTFKCPSGLVSSDIHTPHQVFSIDFAKSGDTTVVTIARVWWDNPIEHNRESRYHVHIENWAEFSGDHEKQFPEIVDFIEKYNVSLGVGDATGMGDPIISRLNAELLRRRAKKGEGYIEIHPFVFSQSSKHEGYSLLKQEWLAARVTYPASPHVQQTKKYKRFIKEMRELIKEYKGNFMSVHHPPGKDYHDDYPDSLMMLVWVVNKHGLHTSLATMKENPRYAAMQERIAQRKKQQSFSGLSKPKKRFWR